MKAELSTTNQDVTFPKRALRFTYYLGVVFAHFYIQQWHRQEFPIPFFIHISYMTQMSFYMDFIYYIYVLILQIPLGDKLKNENFLRFYFKFIYSVSFLVFVFYWTMVGFARDLVLHPGVVIPIVIDYFTHGGNFLFNFLEHAFVYPKEDHKKVNFIFFFFYILAYSFFLKFHAHYNGVVIYPFAAKPLPIFIGTLSFAYILINAGCFTYKLLLKKKGNLKLN